MEKLFEQLKVYLKMDTEIPLNEFEAYYQEVLKFLKEGYESLDQQQLLKMRFTTSILYSNALDRSKRKGPNAKKYKKIAEKSVFWSDAINYKLLESGLTQDQINEADQAISDAI